MATARINNTRHIGAAIGHTASITPDVHAIPFPPLKLRKNGKLCPSTAPKPAYSSMHFGLSTRYYCHFTSPIRRYPDLQIHRIIRDNIRGRLQREGRTEHYREILETVAEQSSVCERRAQEAERESDRLKKAEYMSYHLGEEYEGIISGVTAYGFYVELPNTVEGLVHVTSLRDDYYSYNEETYELSGELSKKVYHLGQKVRVRVADADALRRTVDFTVVEQRRILWRKQQESS